MKRRIVFCLLHCITIFANLHANQFSLNTVKLARLAVKVCTIHHVTLPERVKADPAAWTVTDFNRGNFKQCGRIMTTLRNHKEGGYCEKIIISFDGQAAPAHYHKIKQEDIICVAGGYVEVRKPYNQLPVATLAPGESVTNYPNEAHEFYGILGTPIHDEYLAELGYPNGTVGATIIREISSFCNDSNDNFDAYTHEPLSI